MNSKDYWFKRETEALAHRITDEKQYDREIRRIYQDMLDACQKEIDSFYAKYASAEGISIAEAKKRVRHLDIASYERKAKRYVKDKDFSAKANEEMRLYNATMKINRLEMLKANIGLELIAGHDKLEKFMKDILHGRTEDELKRQAGILGKTVKNNAQKAHAIVNGSFHNGTFSDRIWQYQDLMREDLGRLLQTGLIQGKNPRAIAKDLKKYWYGNDPRTGGGAEYCMERLMRTELARVQTEAQKQSFVRNGFDFYEFICNHNASKHGTCSICQGLNGKHFKVSDMMPGTNAPPMHPNCRCSTAAWEDDEEYEAWLDYLDKGGTTAEWEKIKNAVKLSDIKGTRYHAEIADDLEMYVGGGYGSVFDALGRNPVKMKLIKNSMTEYSKPLYRIEEADFTYKRSNLKKGKQFSFEEDLRSFSRSEKYVREILRPYSDVDYEEPIIFETVGKVKHFNMDAYAENYYEYQSESLAGGFFEVLSISEEVINRKKVKVVKIKQVSKK